MRWKEVRLEEVCEISGGGTPSRVIKEYFGGEIAWFTPTEIAKDRIDKISSSKETITELGLANSSARLLPPGSVLMTSRASIGNVAIIAKQATTNQGFVNFICSPHINNRYLAHWLYSNKNQFENAANGATFKEISRGKIKTFKVPLPDLPTQQHIAAVLDKADALRQQNQQLLTYYDELLQGTFIELFGDPVTNEKGWEKTELLDVGIEDGIKCGPFGSQLHAEEFMHEGVPLWGIKQVNKHFEIPTKEFLSEKKARELSKYSIKPFDIVMTRKGTIGNCAVYPMKYPNGIMHSDLLRIRLDESKCVPVFLSNQLRYSDDITHQISLISSGAIMAGINVGKLKKINVLLPPLPLQKKFAEIVKRIEAQKAQAQAALTESEVLFEGLLAGYFGENQVEMKGSNPGPPTSQLRLF